jgi:hypothetical protein
MGETATDHKKTASSVASLHVHASRRRIRRTLLKSALVSAASVVTLGVRLPRALATDNSAAPAVNQMFLPSVTGTIPQTTSTTDLLFGVYPGGGTGETPNVSPPSWSNVSLKVQSLSGGKPFLVSLYTAWSWYDQNSLDAQIAQFAGSGFQVLLTIKYSPPAGNDGNVTGYLSFLRGVVARYASNPNVVAFIVGNEANVTSNPSSSDGAFSQAPLAVAQGVAVARQQVTQAHSSALVGINFAVTDTSSDLAFLQNVAQLGGSSFASSIQCVGIHVYPGIWPPGTGTPYQEMQSDLTSARQSIDGVDCLRGLPIDVSEVGAPTLSEQDQANSVSQYVAASRDLRRSLGIRSFIWFDLWDADSNGSSPYDHYGLYHSDLTPKLSFDALRVALATGQPTQT